MAIRYVTEDVEELDPRGYINFSIPSLATRRVQMKCKLRDIHEEYDALLLALPSYAMDQHIIPALASDWQGCIEIPNSDYNIELTKQKTINSLYTQRLTNVGYVSELIPESRYGSCPFELRSKFLITTSHTHPIWRGNKLIDAEYRARVADTRVLHPKCDRYLALNAEYAKAFSFSRDNDPLQLVYGMRYCSPPIAFSYTEDEASRDIDNCQKYLALGGLENDHHWSVMHVETKVVYLGVEYLLWIWRHRGWLSIRARNYLEDNPHFVIPDVLLPQCDYSSLRMTKEDEEALLLLLTLDLTQGKTDVGKRSKFKKTLKVDVFNVAQNTESVKELRESDLERNKLSEFIGYDSVSTTVGKTLLPYYIQKQGANPGRGYFAKREIYARVDESDSDCDPDTVDAAKSYTHDASLPEVAEESCLHWLRFKEMEVMLTGETACLVPDVIPLFRAYQSKLHPLLQPAEERKFPYAPREEDPCMRRWKYSLSTACDYACMYLPIPVWDNDTEACKTAYDKAVERTEARKAAAREVIASSTKPTKKAELATAHLTDDSLVVAAKKRLDRIMAMDCTKFCKRLPNQVKQHLNCMNVKWRARAVDAIERVVDQTTANWVMIYIHALIDEHERLEQLKSRLGFLSGLEQEIIVATVQQTPVPPTERKCKAFDLPTIPDPPRMPRMGLGDANLATIDAGALRVDDNKNETLYQKVNNASDE